MAEQIEVRDIEEGARLVKTGKDLLASLQGIRARQLEAQRLTVLEVEYRQRYGDTDGFLEIWEGQLTDLDDDLLETERELREVEDGVEEVARDNKVLLAVHEEYLRIKTTIKK